MKGLSKQKHNIAKFWSLSQSKQWLLAKVFITMTTYKGLLVLFPFKYFMMPVDKSFPQARNSSEENISDVVWAVHLLSTKIPMGFTCLTQALAVKWLLKNQPDIQIRIGIQKSTAEGFSAHAWIVYRDKTILGEQPNQLFEPILEWS